MLSHLAALTSRIRLFTAVTLLSVLDPEGKAPDLYGSYQFPETYVLDRELRIAAKWVGAQPWDKPELRKYLDDLASGQ